MSFNKKYIDSFLKRHNINEAAQLKARETLDAMRARFNKLKRQLEDSPELSFMAFDEIHIVSIVICEELQMLALLDVLELGTIMKVDAAGNIKQKNHSISTYFQMTKLINETSRKLGLSPLDRKDLKIEKVLEDGMDD